MCSYVKDGLCEINHNRCPFMYFCEKQQMWKPNKAMPTQCKVALNFEVPHGYYRVVDVRKNYLYIDMGEYTISVKNPFDDIPVYVKVTQTKSGYKLRK